jgi:hypothetical protein
MARSSTRTSLARRSPLDEYVGTVIAVVLRDDDIDDKLVVGDARDWTADIVTVDQVPRAVLRLDRLTGA